MVPTNGSPVGLGFSYGGSHLLAGRVASTPAPRTLHRERMLSLSHRRLGIPPVGDAPTYPVGQPRVSTVADTALNYFCSNLDTPPNKLGRSPSWTRVFPQHPLSQDVEYSSAKKAGADKLR